MGTSRRVAKSGRSQITGGPEYLIETRASRGAGNPASAKNARNGAEPSRSSPDASVKQTKKLIVLLGLILPKD